MKRDKLGRFVSTKRGRFAARAQGANAFPWKTAIITGAFLIVYALGNIQARSTDGKVTPNVTYAALPETIPAQHGNVNAPVDRFGRVLMRQTDFPCQEDEALMYAAIDAFEGSQGIDALSASRDYVTCVSLDVLINNAIVDALRACQGAPITGYDPYWARPLCAAP